VIPLPLPVPLPPPLPPPKAPPPLLYPPPLPGVKGRSDLQALNAAWSAGLDCSSLNRPLKPPLKADGLGRVTPCADRQLSNLLKAALNPPDPPNPDGRSEAQALRALSIVLLLGALELLPLEPPPKPVTPCSRRQLK